MAKIEITCPREGCGAVRAYFPSQLTTDKPRYCSRACYLADQAEIIPDHVCEQCGRTFKPWRQNRNRTRYCSHACHNAAGWAEATCPCGGTFPVRKAEARDRGSHLRCPACTTRGRPRVAKIETPCAHCGAPVLRYPSVMQRMATGRVFCDAQCRAAGKARLSQKPMRNCEQCGTEFQQGRGAPQRFCSMPCHDEWRRERNVLKTCPACSEQFYSFPSNYRRYCSLSCYQAQHKTPEGARKLTGDGYVIVWAPGHPNAQASGWVFEHRMVMAELLGRALLPHEQPHHINTVKSDNSTDGPLRWVNGHLRSGNLELWTHSQPSGGRVGEVGPVDTQLYPAASS